MSAKDAPDIEALVGLVERAIANGWPAEEVGETLGRAVGPTVEVTAAPAPSAPAMASSETVRGVFARAAGSRGGR